MIGIHLAVLGPLIRQSKVSPAVLLVALLGASARCTDPSYIRTRYTAVYGVVTGTAGTTVAGAKVHVLAFAEGCTGRTIGDDLTTSDSTGHYWVRVVGTDVVANPACISVSARGPSAVDSTVVAGPMVLFSNKPAHFEDSVRVDVRLP